MPTPENNQGMDQALHSGPLFQRVVTAFVLMPFVLGAVHLGGRIFSAMIAFVCIVMIFEWMRMVERKEFSPAFYLLAVGAMAAFFAASSGNYAWAFFITAISGIGVWALAQRTGGRGLWQALTAPYIIAPSLALVWLRFEIENGRALAFILFFIVWAADTGAFIFGKFIGGPKISHALSPSKTWAGIGGGVLGGGLVGPLAAWVFLDGAMLFSFIFVGGVLGAASVAGDLAESAFKRNFGLKDISGFIPGHGGALDRLDGMIFATTVMTSALFIYMLLGKQLG